MKKKYWVILAVVLLALAVIPIPTGIYKDGGTRVYQALTYKIVDWNRIYTDDGNGIYHKTRVYLIPHCWRSLDSLWEREEESMEHTLRGTVTELHGGNVTVSANDPAHTGDFTFSAEALEPLDIQPGSHVMVTYVGSAAETAPKQITAVRWSFDRDSRPASFDGGWMEETPAEEGSDRLPADVVITEIYSNCFFAQPLIPLPYTIKINGVLPDNWCIGDQVKVTYKNQRYDAEIQRAEADLVTIGPSDFELEPGVAYKPVIYLYPEQETEVAVNLKLDGQLTCTYPVYRDGWNVTAQPDGTLTDESGMTYNYLYWEGETCAQYDFSKGFCVAGEETAAFLEKALSQLGLTRREANEFIVYWLPLMQDNPYNIIAFQEDCYRDSAKLVVSPEPDTLIRVFMAWKPSEKQIPMEPQDLAAPQRNGFTVVEWGGTMVPIP